MVPAQTRPPSQATASRTVPFALAGSVAATAVIVALFWPQAPAPVVDPVVLTEFDDEVTGRGHFVIGLGHVPMAGLPEDAVAGLELILRTPPPAEQGELTAGVTLYVEASGAQLLDAPSTATIKVGTVEGPVPLRRIEVEDHGRVTSGLYGEIPWGLVIGLATGAPASLQIAEQRIPFPAVTQAQVLKALRSAKKKGHPFRTFGVDIMSDKPTSPPAAPATPQPAQPAAAPSPSPAAPTAPPPANE